MPSHDLPVCPLYFHSPPPHAPRSPHICPHAPRPPHISAVRLSTPRPLVLVRLVLAADGEPRLRPVPKQRSREEASAGLSAVVAAASSSASFSRMKFASRTEKKIWTAGAVTMALSSAAAAATASGAVDTKQHQHQVHQLQELLQGSRSLPSYR